MYSLHLHPGIVVVTSAQPLTSNCVAVEDEGFACIVL